MQFPENSDLLKIFNNDTVKSTYCCYTDQNKYPSTQLKKLHKPILKFLKYPLIQKSFSNHLGKLMLDNIE